MRRNYFLLRWLWSQKSVVFILSLKGVILCFWKRFLLADNRYYVETSLKILKFSSTSSMILKLLFPVPIQVWTYWLCLHINMSFDCTTVLILFCYKRWGAVLCFSFALLLVTFWRLIEMLPLNWNEGILLLLFFSLFRNYTAHNLDFNK